MGARLAFSLVALESAGTLQPVRTKLYKKGTGITTVIFWKITVEFGIKFDKLHRNVLLLVGASSTSSVRFTLGKGRAVRLACFSFFDQQSDIELAARVTTFSKPKSKIVIRQVEEELPQHVQYRG
jgi:hypothetical protein